jgi:hypothetical protein
MQRTPCSAAVGAERGTLFLVHAVCRSTLSSPFARVNRRHRDGP